MSDHIFNILPDIQMCFSQISFIYFIFIKNDSCTFIPPPINAKRSASAFLSNKILFSVPLHDFSIKAPFEKRTCYSFILLHRGSAFNKIICFIPGKRRKVEERQPFHFVHAFILSKYASFMKRCCSHIVVSIICRVCETAFLLFQFSAYHHDRQYKR